MIFYYLDPRFFFFCIRLLNSSSAGSHTGLFVSNNPSEGIEMDNSACFCGSGAASRFGNS